MKRWGWIAVLVLLLGLTVPASANVPDSFTACGSDTKGGECTKTVSVARGSKGKLWLRVGELGGLIGRHGRRRTQGLRAHIHRGIESFR